MRCRSASGTFGVSLRAFCATSTNGSTSNDSSKARCRTVAEQSRRMHQKSAEWGRAILVLPFVCRIREAGMIRPVLTELALFLAPFVAYAIFLWATRAGVFHPDAWSRSRLASLTIAALVLLLGSFFVLA